MRQVESSRQEREPDPFCSAPSRGPQELRTSVRAPVLDVRCSEGLLSQEPRPWIIACSPDTTPDSPTDQTILLMTVSQSFRYFKGILIFLQTYSIFDPSCFLFTLPPSCQEHSMLTEQQLKRAGQS